MEVAQSYFDNYGWIPISCSIMVGKDDKITKIPTSKKWSEITSSDWKDRFTDNGNFGIITGKKTGVIVIDVDVSDNGMKAMNSWLKKHEMPQTVVCKSQSGGMHYYFKYNDELPDQFKKCWSKCFLYKGEKVGIDIRSNGGWIVCPPSKFKKSYKWINDPRSTEIADIPNWLLKKVIQTPTENKYDKKKEVKTNDEDDELLTGGEEYHAKLFCDNFKNKVIIKRLDPLIIYIWYPEQCIWKPVNKEIVIIRIVKYLKKLIKSKITELSSVADKKSIDKIDEYAKAFKRYVTYRHCTFVFNLSKESLLAEDIEFDSNPDVLNFRNGLVELDTGNFRKRTKKDYISKYIKYDYKESSEETEAEILKILKQICNDDDELLDFNLRWLGYCITGRINEGKALFTVGHGASNGKSTMARMMDIVFEIYCIKMASEFFTTGYSKRDKQLATLEGTVRYVYLEEVKQLRLDVDFLKDMITAGRMSVNKLYREGEQINIVAKFNYLSNYDPIFAVDNGMKRRGFLQNFKNKFLEKEPYEQAIEKNNEKEYSVYPANTKLFDDFKANESQKLAFANIIIRYAKKYYDEGPLRDLECAKKPLEWWNDIVGDNDHMQKFIDEHCEATGSSKDKVLPDEFMVIWNSIGNKKDKWENVRNDVKRYFRYDRKKRKDGKQGVILGLKLKIQEHEQEEY